ncbi:MAG: hypothetical protein QNJ81_12165 [Acidimicrobiia bacterium]|nr:hypothetical protein [Acidimicrobiia bacterium]
MTDRDSADPRTPSAGWRHKMRSVEAAAIAGIVAAVGWVYTLERLLAGPGVEATEAEIAQFFASPDTGWDTLVLLQIMVLATAGFLWFVGVIRTRIGESAPRLFDTVFAGGAILFAGLLFIGSAALAAPFILADRGITVDPGGAALLRSYALVVLAVFAPRVAALVVFSSSTLGLRTGTLPRWLVLIGYLVGIVMLLNVTFFSPSVYIFPGWIALVSLVLLVRHHPTDGDTSGE